MKSVDIKTNNDNFMECKFLIEFRINVVRRKPWQVKSPLLDLGVRF